MNNVELKFPSDIHDFEESVARRNKLGEKKYVCSKCGLVGWVKKDATTILIKKGNKDAIENCSKAGEGFKTKATLTNPNIGKYVRLLSDVKLSNGVTIPRGSEHKVVECPESHKKEFNMKIWIVFNEEYTKLFDSEREFIDAPPVEEAKVVDEVVEEEEVIVEIEETPVEVILDPNDKDDSHPEAIVTKESIETTGYEKIVESTDKQVDEHIEVMDEKNKETEKIPPAIMQTKEVTPEEAKEIYSEKKTPQQEIQEAVEDRTYDNLKKKTGVMQSLSPDEFKNGKYQLEDSDKISYGLDMAAANHEIDQLTEELNSYKKKYKDLIDIQKKIVSEKGTAIINGFEEKPIICELYLDYDKGKRLWRDKVNGNVIKIEDMKPDDYQMDFTYKTEEITEEEEC